MIWSCGYYTGNISSFSDNHLKSVAQKVKPCIKDTIHYLGKLKTLGKLPQGTILRSIDVAGLYPKMSDFSR